MKKQILISILCTTIFASAFEDAKVAFENKSYDKALEILQGEIDAKTANAKAFELASQTAFRLDDLDKANEFILKAIDGDPGNKEYRAYQKELENLKNALKDAKKTVDSGYLEEALSEYDKLLESHPENAMIYYSKGLVYKKLNQFEDAVSYYKKAISFNPIEEKYSKAILVVAQTMAKQGDEEFRRREYDTALSYYQNAVNYMPTFSGGLFRMAKTYFSLKDFENAQIWSIKTIESDGEHVQAIKMLGDTYKRGGNLTQAIEEYKKAVSINSNYDRAYYSLGVAYKDNQQFDLAIDALNKALLITPSYTKAYETLGVVYQEKNDLENAITNYQRAIDTDRKAYKIYYRLSSVYNIMEDFEKARDAAKECLRIKRNYAAAMCELGIAEMNMCNKVAAEDAFTKAKKDRNYRKFAGDYLKNLNYYTKDCK